ncbi:hypothetical protein SAMN05216593_116128 [Pseudomonas asturiensis]|uniref:TIGR02646 family protein n=1 Tax=Pseudomonas asturiensis TaxID=1190415 RepID=A0A1M7Q235_9PSED|nr:hypothetical protein [Pseudomonas asturiensis]SHN24159.1 hypothetical protein SAMN05216593_116128 [Pseudomonas asturiensis]
MRKIKIPDGQTPPQDWLEEASRITSALASAESDEERDNLIEKHATLWRDDRIRNWLLGLFNNKCWYTEAQESVSAYHVDHYRPKGRVNDIARTKPESGYWWLAFDWQNYRICGQLINVKKSDVFPLFEGDRATHGTPSSLRLEAPFIIDPLTDDASLISFEMDEDGCRAVPMPGAEEDDCARVAATIEIIGLNRLDRLNQKRAEVWRECQEKLSSYNAAAGEPLVLRSLRRAMIVEDLRKRVRYQSELSSVAEACIRKLGSEVVRAKVHG